MRNIRIDYISIEYTTFIIVNIVPIRLNFSLKILLKIVIFCTISKLVVDFISYFRFITKAEICINVRLYTIFTFIYCAICLSISLPSLL